MNTAASASPIAASPKRATNLSLSADVLDAAKALRINVSKVCDQHLREVVKQERERQWRAENAEFIAAYNDVVEREGLPLSDFRAF